MARNSELTRTELSRLAESRSQQPPVITADKELVALRSDIARVAEVSAASSKAVEEFTHEVEALRREVRDKVSHPGAAAVVDHDLSALRKEIADLQKHNLGHSDLGSS